MNLGTQVSTSNINKTAPHRQIVKLPGRDTHKILKAHCNKWKLQCKEIALKQVRNW